MLLVCAAPVIASYFAYFVHPARRRARNYSELIVPPRPMPAGAAADRPATARAVAPPSLHGQWLLVVVAGGACDARCERHLWLQRQLRETLGREKDRVDKVWLVDDAATPRARDAGGDRRASARRGAAPATVLRVDRAALAALARARRRATRSRTISTSSIRAATG